MRPFNCLAFLLALLPPSLLLLGCGSNPSPAQPEATAADETAAQETAAQETAAQVTGPQAAFHREAPPNLSVLLDGKVVAPRLEFIGSDREHPAYWLDIGITLAIGQERELDFSWEGDAQERLFLTLPQGGKRLVGARVTARYAGEERIAINPLAALNEDELRALWGVELDHWSSDVEASLSRLDFQRTCVTITDDAASSNAGALPSLPAGIRMLRVLSHSSDGLRSLESLKKLRNLTALSVQGLSRAPLDCSLWQPAQGLKYLNVSGASLRSAGPLASFPELQVLDISYCRGIADLGFAKRLTSLQEIRLSGTQVADLSPLNGLPRLQIVTANMTPVRTLPASATSLTEFSILSSQAREADVQTFRDAHPDCKVSHRWVDTLVSAVANADRLRVRSGGTCHRNEAGERTLFETADADEIEQLLKGLEVVEEDSGFHCMCCGDPSLEFYREDKLLATLGFHHGVGMRWVERWPGDAALSPQAASFLVDWLAARNVRGPRDELDAQAEEARAAERKLAQTTAPMSPILARAFTANPRSFKDVLEREVPDPGEQTAVWLRVLGTGNGSWSQLDGIEQVADEALRSYDEATLATAVEKALLGEDRQLRRGAARLWMSWQSPLENWKPAHVADLHRIVLRVKRDARYYPLRMEALRELAVWSEELSAEEVERQLLESLRDPAPQVRRQAMLIAGQMKHQPSAPLLVDVLRGEPISPGSLPDVPTREQTDVPEGFGDVAEGCSDKEVAALSLGLIQHFPAKALIEPLEPSSAMKAVALALLGEGQLLRPEHFKTADDNQQLQLAAVEAVVRSKGEFGLGFALEYEQATHWWEEEFVAKALSQMLMQERAPASDLLADCTSLAELREWFHDHGKEYLTRFNK